MIEFKENEVIDWFRVLVDIRKEGITYDSMSERLDIPKSSLMDYKRNSRPKLEEGIRIIKLWHIETKQDYSYLPRKDRYSF